jgi:hypothetical protein
MSGHPWKDGARPIGKPLSAMFIATGFGFAVCRICGARVKRNALAYSGHLRGKQHEAAASELAEIEADKELEQRDAKHYPGEMKP